MVVTAERVYDRVKMLAGPQRYEVDEQDILRYFRIPPDDADAKPVIDALVVSGFLSRYYLSASRINLLSLTNRGLPSSAARRFRPDGTVTEPPVQLVPGAAGDVAIAYDPEDGLFLTAGPAVPGWDVELGDGDKVCAYLGDDDLPGLRRALASAGRAAQAGQPYEHDLNGTDLGDVQIRVEPGSGQVQLTVVPYGYGETDDDDSDLDFGDEDYEDLDDEQRAAWAQELAEERAQREANRPPPPPPLTAVLDAEQLNDLTLRLGAKNGRLAPAGCPPV
jgi:hypothetical protein